MVNIALCAVKEYALGVVHCFFKNSSCKAGPVCGNLRATDRIGVVAEVGKYEIRTVFAVETKYVYAFVQKPDGFYDIGIVYAGVRLRRTVFHKITAVECNVFGFADRPTHFSGFEIVDCEYCRIYRCTAYRLCVFRFLLGERLAVTKPTCGVRVGRVDKDSLRGDFRCRGDICFHRIHVVFEHTHRVHGH